MKIEKKYKHIFADMDGTICESKQVISKEMIRMLSKHNVYVISGAKREQMEKQLKGLKCTIMAQSGNDTDLWYKELSKDEIKEVTKHIQKICKELPTYFRKKKDLIENRGCQISFSFVGHNAKLKDKISFDPDKKIRKKILTDIPFISRNMVAKIAGTTCIDYTNKRDTKGKNIKEYIEQMGFKKEECVFYGDNLFNGGNDGSVIGVIDCVEVTSPKDILL